MSTENDLIGKSSGGTGDDEGALRRSLRQVTVAWLFGAVWMYIISSAAFTRYGELLGLSKFGFGLLAALPCAASLVQIPVGYFVERFGHHKTVFIVAGVMHRGTWVLVGLVPLLLPHPLWPAGLLAFVFLQAVLGNVPVPVWYTWMGELVPASIRGRYFSRRSMFGQFVGLVTIVIVGAVLDVADGFGPMVVTDTISIMMIAAGLIGTIDFLCFLPVIPPVAQRAGSNVALKDIMLKPLRDRNFLKFVGFWATMTLGIGLMGQFLWLYLLQELGFSKLKVNILLLGVPLLVTAAGVWIWGRVIDRFGRRPVLVICGLMVSLGGIAWVFVTRDRLFPAYAVVLITTFAWPGIDLANFNILVGMCESLGNRKYRMGYIMIYSMIGAIAGFTSGIVGGTIAEQIGDWHGTILGWPMTYHRVLFTLSAGLRLLALLWLIGLVDARSNSTRETLKYMAGELVLNIQQAAAVPFRVAGWVGRWTYKLNQKGPQDPKRS